LIQFDSPDDEHCVARNMYRSEINKYEGWNFNSGNYLFTTDTK